jgi:hypothetical protein
MKSRAKTMGLHEWSKNDTILTLYVTKFGTSGLFLKTLEDVANHIGVSAGSLKMQMANIRTLLGDNTASLTDFSKLQKEVFEEFNGLHQFQFVRVVKEVTGQNQMELISIFKRMGKDPQKMVKVV